jgi:ureidoacrylate peracid hydrolase
VEAPAEISPWHTARLAYAPKWNLGQSIGSCSGCWNARYAGRRDFILTPPPRIGRGWSDGRRKETPVKLNRREFVQTTAFGLAATSTTVVAQAPPAARPPARNRVITLDAKPEPITIDIAKTAVIVVDMQNDFGTKGGMFDRGGIDISQIQAAVGPTSKVMSSARRNGIKIVYLKMAFRRDLSDLGSSDSKNRLNHMRLNVGKVVRAPDGRESRILIRDTWNTDIVKELTPHADDVVVYKHRFSGFFQTNLDAILKKLGVKHLIVTGCTTSVCVESTVRDAMFRDYTSVVLADCAAEPIGHDLPRSNHMASLLTIETSLGWVFDSEGMTKALDARPISSASL